jgi:hypothetical protein
MVGSGRRFEENGFLQKLGDIRVWRVTHPKKLIECPFEVRIDGMAHDHFYDVRDAVASARSAKRNKLSSTVVVTDVRTGKLVIEVEE